MQKQSLSRQALVQQVKEECLEDAHESFGYEQIATLTAPATGPVVNLQVVVPESRRWSRRDGSWRFNSSTHAAIHQSRVAELLTEVSRQRIYPEAFNGFAASMEDIELASTLRVPEILPVGGLVASSGEAWLFDKGFQQDRTIGVSAVPVIGQAACGHRKKSGGEIFALNPGQNQ